MSNTCTTCGRTGSQAIADARSVGLLQEFQRGIYTCCQVAEWADEQTLAWFEATREDCNPDHESANVLEFDETEALLVRVRARRPQVPWYKNPEDLSH